MQARHQLVLNHHHIWVKPGADRFDINYPDEAAAVNSQIEKFSFWFKHRNRIILNTIRHFPFSGNFADIGGGNGYQTAFLSRFFASRQFFLIEPGMAGCRNAAKTGLKHIFNIEAQDFDFFKHQIGGIGLFDVLEHVDDKLFLKQLVKQCPKKCYFYITVPAYSWLWSDVDDFGRHQRRYDFDYIRKLAQDCKITLHFTSHFFFYLPPLIFLAKSLPYKLHFKKNPSEIINSESKFHQPPLVIKKLFEKFNYWELKQIKGQKMIPFGSSCLAVFQN